MTGKEDLLVGIGSFKEGVDCFRERSRHRKRVLSSHGERTGPSRAAYE